MTKRAYEGARYVPASSVRRRYEINEKTLRTWANDGKLACLRLGDTGKRLYDLEDVRRVLGDTRKASEDNKRKLVYARVSSAQQRDDLLRQIKDLSDAYPGHEVVSDVGSGLNFKRKGLKTILEQAIKGDVAEVVVMHRDRLCRFGADLVEFVLETAGTRLVVHGKAGDTTDTRELADDLLAVTTVFVAKHNGLRSGENRRRRKALERAQKEAAGDDRMQVPGKVGGALSPGAHSEDRGGREQALQLRQEAGTKGVEACGRDAEEDSGASE